MADNSKNREDFWDIESLVPNQRKPRTFKKSIDTVEIDISSSSDKELQKKSNEENRLTYSENTTINRRITFDKPVDNSAFESVEKYIVQESPIHSVTLNKRKCEYHFYNAFREDAIRYISANVRECEYVPFFSYVPQYDQLSQNQLNYYLFWRECFKNGNYIKTDVSYVLLFAFELINLGAYVDVKRSQYLLVELWNVYHEMFPSIEAKLSAWICDFSLIHRLSVPENADFRIVKSERVLREFYISMPEDDPQKCVRSLIKYCSSYDYSTSKFAVGDKKALFDLHVFFSLIYVWKNYNDGKGFLSGFTCVNSSMSREAYTGALCCSQEKYRIDIEYSSFSRMNELRYFIGDMIKYAENKIRAALGVKSRLMVYSASPDLYKLIDEYFENALPSRSLAVKKKEEQHEYDVLYDIPKKEFSLSDAKRIEEASWETTNELISAFEDEAEEEFAEHDVAEISKEELPCTDGVSELSLKEALGEAFAFVVAIKNGDRHLADEEARKLGKIKESVVDYINDIAIEVIGDILIDGDGDDLEIPECYRDLI